MVLIGDDKREYQRIWLANRVNAWIEENGPCSNCETTLNLQVDHINPKLKTMNTRHIFSLSPSNPKRIMELANCQVLCNDCHVIKTKSQTYAPVGHGTYTMYSKYYCRCIPCKRSNADYRLKRRKELKVNGIAEW